MKHRLKGRKFNRNTGQRKALLRSLAIALVERECIKTTVAKAKDIRPVVEKLITIGKKGTLSARRNLISVLGNNEKVAAKIFDVLAVRYKARNGGYLRILKTGFRKGDCAPMSVIQFVNDEAPAEIK